MKAHLRCSVSVYMIEAGSTSDVKYMGGVSDASGLYYLNARHYDANTGRFLQQDTYKGNPYAPWTQNLYAYNYAIPSIFKEYFVEV